MNKYDVGKQSIKIKQLPTGCWNGTLTLTLLELVCLGKNVSDADPRETFTELVSTCAQKRVGGGADGDLPTPAFSWLNSKPPKPLSPHHLVIIRAEEALGDQCLDPVLP